MGEHQHSGYKPINLSLEEILVAQVFPESYEQPALLPEADARNAFIQGELFKSSGTLVREVVSVPDTITNKETKLSAFATSSFLQPQLDLCPQDRLF